MIKDTKLKIFICSHLDDLEFGCGGYLASQYINNDKSIYEILVLSEGRERDSKSDTKKRKKAFENNIEFLKEKFNINYTINNCKVDTEFQSNYEQVKKEVIYFKNNLLNKYSGNVELFTQSPDNHQDHKITNDICKEVFRPLNENLKIEKFIEFQIINPKTFIDDQNWNLIYKLSEPELNLKRDFLIKYPIKKRNDYRDIDFTLEYNKLSGKAFGLYAAEKYRTIYEFKSI